MARTATMTAAQCEDLLGPRGSLHITVDNRAIVRKWLVAKGASALDAGKLTLAELSAAYNHGDHSASFIQKAITHAQALTVQTHSAAIDGGNSFDTAAAIATTKNENYTPPPPKANGHDPAAQLARLISDIAGKSVDADAVARIVDQKISEAFARVPSVTIELKTADGTVTKLDGHHHPKFATLLKAATARLANGYHPNIWISGPAGSGKTHAAHAIARAMQCAYHYNGALSMPHELLGFIDAGGSYHVTPFRRAYEAGGLYLFDECDGSDNRALLALNAALANGVASFPDKAIERHPDSIIIATANTFGQGATAEYVGRAKIDAAFLSRFPIKIFWDYDVALEVEISGNRDFARRVIAARERARAAGLKILIDPRHSQAGASLIAQGFNEQEAAELTYLAGLTADQVKILEAK